MNSKKQQDSTSTSTSTSACDDHNTNNHNHNNHDNDNPRISNNKTSHSKRTLTTTTTSIITQTNLIKLAILVGLCGQKTAFTIVRRYSAGVLKEDYSKHEVLLLSEILKILCSAAMIFYHYEPPPSSKTMYCDVTSSSTTTAKIAPYTSVLVQWHDRLLFLARTSGKMLLLSLIYGAMNILGYISLQNIGAGLYTMIVQCKLLTTALFCVLLLKKSISWARWRSFVVLIVGVMLFSEPLWRSSNSDDADDSRPSLEAMDKKDYYYKMALGTTTTWLEVILCGFASIYFENVIKNDPLELTIWERNFQLGLGSVPIYILFLVQDGGGTVGYFQGWSVYAWLLAVMGAGGGMLVALTLKYADSIVKTLTTTGAIVLIALFDHFFLNGPLTFSMIMAGIQVIVAICDYTFDTTPAVDVVINPQPIMTSSKQSSSVIACYTDPIQPSAKPLLAPVGISGSSETTKRNVLTRRTTQEDMA